MATSRREFLRGLGQTGVAAWLGAELALDAMATPAASAPTGTERGILRARFLATRLDEMAAFYADTMGWPVERDGASLQVRAGGTELRFDPTAKDDAPYYHVAWAIPSNKFEAGKAWLAERTPLLKNPDGIDEFHFRGANRRAVYFADPAANILELIARDDLGDAAPGAFGLADVLYVNHVGLVVDDMDAAIANLTGSLGLAPTAPPLPTFTKLGDPYRHVVLVPEKRLWLPEMSRGAEVFAAEVVMHGPEARTLELTRLPYRVAIES
jgi:catechol-2,3-dioxygenase